MKELIVKDNALINASYSLELVEQRLILLAIVEARESGKGINANDPLTVHAESYINHFSVHRNTAYQALKDACKDLFARQFSYQEQRIKGVANITSRWVSQIAYIDNSATVELIFSPAIIPLITRLEKQFTSYELEQVSGLNTAYAVRLYELLIGWRSSGKTPVLELNVFRQKLGVLETEYKRMYDFKKYVLEPSLKQINQHTDITTTVEQHKKGRVISGFSFSFKQKIAEKPKRVKEPKQQEKHCLVWGTSENHLFKELGKKCVGLSKEYVEQLARKHKQDLSFVLNDMFMKHAKSDSFELELTD